MSSFLFSTTQSSNVEKPYYIDSLVYNYIDDNTVFNKNLPLDDYFVLVQNVNIKYQNAKAIDNFINTKATELNLTKIQRTSLPTNTLNTINNNELNTQLINDFNGDINNTDIFLEILENRNANDVIQLKQNLIKNIDKSIKEAGQIIAKSTDNTTFNTTLNSKGHREFTVYLNEVNNSISYSFFEIVKTLLSDEPKDFSSISNNTERVNKELADKIRVQAIKNIKGLYAERNISLRNSIRLASQKSINYIIKNLKNKNYQDFVNAFSSRNSMINGSNIHYYYYLRTIMYDFLKIDKSIFYEDNPQIYEYMKKILVDLYIKTCYPLIQYDFLDVLLKKYTLIGDFVNARFTLLAKVLFTFNLVDGLASAINENLIPTSVKNDFPTNIYTYIQRNNKGNLSSNGTREDTLKSILINLHNMSNDVISTTESVQIVQNSIHNNQQSLRNMIYNTNNIDKILKSKLVEYYILISLIFIVIFVCGLLMFLNYSDYSILFATIVIATVIIYNLIVVIMKFINKN